MPDLQSELSKINQTIASWEAPEVPETTVQTSTAPNASKASFEYVRANPGVRRARAIDALIACGYKRSSVSTLLTQMAHQGMIRSDDGILTALIPEYTPLKPQLFKKNYKKPATPTKAKPKAKKLEITPGDKAMLESIQVVPMPELSADYILTKLSVVEAKKLYDALRQFFG